MQVGIEIHGKEQDKESKKQVSQTLRELMARLESDKATVSSLPGYADDAAYVEGIALRVFDAADNEDRAGRASKCVALLSPCLAPAPPCSRASAERRRRTFTSPTRSLT